MRRRDTCCQHCTVMASPRAYLRMAQGTGPVAGGNPGPHGYGGACVRGVEEGETSREPAHHRPYHLGLGLTCSEEDRCRGVVVSLPS